jgi:hypothetical protein
MVSLAIPFEIFPPILQPDRMFLEKPVKVLACFEPQNTAELGSGELPFPICFKRDRFEGSTRKLLARARKSRGEFVWKVKDELLHIRSIASRLCNTGQANPAEPKFAGY